MENNHWFKTCQTFATRPPSLATQQIVHGVSICNMVMQQSGQPNLIALGAGNSIERACVNNIGSQITDFL